MEAASKSSVEAHACWSWLNFAGYILKTLCGFSRQSTKQWPENSQQPMWHVHGQCAWAMCMGNSFSKELHVLPVKLWMRDFAHHIVFDFLTCANLASPSHGRLWSKWQEPQAQEAQWFEGNSAICEPERFGKYIEICDKRRGTNFGPNQACERSQDKPVGIFLHVWASFCGVSSGGLGWQLPKPPICQLLDIFARCFQSRWCFPAIHCSFTPEGTIFSQQAMEVIGIHR